MATQKEEELLPLAPRVWADDELGRLRRNLRPNETPAGRGPLPGSREPAGVADSVWAVGLLGPGPQPMKHRPSCFEILVVVGAEFIDDLFAEVFVFCLDGQHVAGD